MAYLSGLLGNRLGHVVPGYSYLALVPYYTGPNPELIEALGEPIYIAIGDASSPQIIIEGAEAGAIVGHQTGDVTISVSNTGQTYTTLATLSLVANVPAVLPDGLFSSKYAKLQVAPVADVARPYHVVLDEYISLDE
jgi:hypothetical protein